MKRIKKNENRLTNPMRGIVTGLVLTYLGYTLLGIVLMLAVASFFNPTPEPEFDYDEYLLTGEIVILPAEETEDADFTAYRIWTSLFVFALYSVSAYNIGWQYGLRDRNVVKLNYARRNDWRGLIAGSCAQIPMAVMLLAFWVLSPLGVNIRPWFELSHYMYSWLFFLPAPLYALFLPLTPLLAHFGFRNGYNDVSLRRKLIYTDPERERKKKEKQFR